MRRRAPLVAATLAVLLALLAWWFLVEPKREERAVLLEEIEGIRTRQQVQRLEIQRLEEIRDNELEVRAAIARLEQYIPGGTAQPSAIRQIQLAADAAGVDIVAVTFADPQAVLDAPQPYEAGMVLAQIPATLVVEGGYFQVSDFLRRVETELPRAVLVDSVDITEAASPGTFPLLNASLTARLFAVVPAGAVGVEQPDPQATPDPDAPPATPAPTPPAEAVT